MKKAKSDGCFGEKLMETQDDKLFNYLQKWYPHESSDFIYAIISKLYDKSSEFRLTAKEFYLRVGDKAWKGIVRNIAKDIIKGGKL